MTREEINRRTGFIDSPAVAKSYPWRTVTGADFARSFRWAKTWRNPLSTLIKNAKEKLKHDRTQ